MAPLVKLSLRLRGYARTIGLVSRFRRSPVAGFDEATELARLSYASMRRLPFHLTCLEGSVVIWWLLGGDRSAGEIRFGVTTDGDKDQPSFHAWVEHGGHTIDDGTEHLDRYLPFTGQSEPQPESFD